MGGGHACGVVDGELYCWGALLGDTPGGRVPARIGTWNDWDMVRVGDSFKPELNFACGLRSGAIYCWGANNHGQLGTGDTTSRLSPTQVGMATDWTTVAVGSEHACGLRNSRLYCWGANREGQLGVPIQVPIGNDDDHPTVQQIGTDADWSVISVGDYHSCGLRSGAPYCWGLALGGVLGLPSSGTFGVPATRVGNDNTWVSLSLTRDRSCGERNADLYCWGANTNDIFGLGNTNPIDSPLLIPTPSG
jgi:alpha-tubulin suppressor-like RCC1 family protein